MDEDPTLQQMRKTWETAENPVMAAIAQLTHALLTNSIEMSSAFANGTIDDRLLPMVDARIEAAFAALEKIPQERWDQWCEMPKQDLINTFRGLFRQAEADVKLRNKH